MKNATMTTVLISMTLFCFSALAQQKPKSDGESKHEKQPVSYTHLTLPTIYSV